MLVLYVDEKRVLKDPLFTDGVYAPESTSSVADGHLKIHLEADWMTFRPGHITSDSVNKWIWKKRKQGLSWLMIENILRTM